MKNIIKELYFGNIEPQTRSFENDSFLQKQMSIISSCEQALTDRLKGEDKNTFLAFANASNIVLSESELDRFIVGFRFGAKFIYDTFVSNDAPYRDYLKEEFE